MTRRSEFLERQAALIDESTITIGGESARLLTAGSAGRLVLLVTGAGRGVRADTSLLLPMLARHRRVAALELADLAQPWRDGSLAVSAALDHLAVPEAVVVGHGLGASVAIVAADADPRVRAVALVAGWLHPTERLLTTARLWAAVDGEEARADLARLLAVRSLAGLGPDRGAPWSTGAATSRLLAASAEADPGEAATRLRIPALVVACSSDAVVGVEGAEALLGAIDDARYAVVDAGHAVLAERPAELLAVLEHFLADPSRDPAGSVLPRMTV